jgi:hypothetical protein
VSEQPEFQFPLSFTGPDGIGATPFEDYAEAAEEALRHFELWGRPAHGLAGLPSALVHGPRPANEALRTLDRALDLAPASPLLRAASSARTR